MQVLVPLTKDKVAHFSSKALLALAYIVDEENNKAIMANAGWYGARGGGGTRYIVGWGGLLVTRISFCGS